MNEQGGKIHRMFGKRGHRDRSCPRKGFVLILILLVGVFILGLALSLLTFVSANANFIASVYDRIAASNIAEAGIAETLYNLEIDPLWGRGPTYPPPIDGKPSEIEGSYFISFSPADFNGETVRCYSVNNFYNMNPADGWRGPGTVPPYSCQLISRGRYRDIEKRIEVILKQADTSLVTGGRIAVFNDLNVISKVDGLPVSIHSNSRAHNEEGENDWQKNAITVTGSGNVRGSVSASGSIHMPNITPEKGVHPYSYPINIPLIDIEYVLREKMGSANPADYAQIPQGGYLFEPGGLSPTVRNEEGTVILPNELAQWGWMVSNEPPGCILRCSKNMIVNGDLSLRLTSQDIQSLKRLLIESNVSPGRDVEILTTGDLNVTGSLKGRFEVYTKGSTTIYGSSESEIESNDIAIYSNGDMTILTYEPTFLADSYCYFSGLVYTHGNATIASPRELPTRFRQTSYYQGVLVAVNFSDPHGNYTNNGNFFTNNQAEFQFDPACMARLKFLNNQRLIHSITLWNEW